MANVIDIHVHYGTPENPQTGCYWSERFEHTAAYYLLRVVLNSIFRKPTPEYIHKVLLKAVNKSKLVNKTVMLALDEVYDPNGVRHKEWTHLHVPNDFLTQLAHNNERILFGASVHPYRNDWEEQLDFCLQNGAVLCKWIPSSQQIDPSNPLCDRFYRKLIQHNLPLLCHAGPEYTIPTSCEQYDEFNNPKYVERALDMGVTVILAHCALPYFGELDKKYQDDYDDFMRMMREADNKNWNLYADLSATTTTFRAPYMDDIVENIPHERLLFGSDFPIPSSLLSYNKLSDIFKWLRYVIGEVLKFGNPLDRNYKLIKGMGFDPIIYSHAETLFSQIKR